MNRRSKAVVDPQALERIRAVRATEDSAISEVFRHVGLVEAAQGRRTEALRTLDADVRRAEEALAEARGALVSVAGLQRAATMLDVTAAAMRKLLPAGRHGRPPEPARKDAIGSDTIGQETDRIGR